MNRLNLRSYADTVYVYRDQTLLIRLKREVLAWISPECKVDATGGCKKLETPYLDPVFSLSETCRVNMEDWSAHRLTMVLIFRWDILSLVHMWISSPTV